MTKTTAHNANRDTVRARRLPATIPTEWAPSLVSLAVVVLAVASSMPWMAFIGATAIMTTAPIARTLLRRVQLWAIGGLAAAGLASAVPGVPVIPVLAILLLTIGLAVGVGTSKLQGRHGWRPQVGGADMLVVISGVLVFLLLALPYRGSGADGVLLDLARAFDTRSHYMMVHNLLLEGSTNWTSADGSPPEFADSYPLGVHLLIALALLIVGSQDPTQVVGFAALVALVAALSALLLGALAVDIAQRTGLPSRARGRGLIAASIAAIVLPLGGLIAGAFELGHTNLLFAATIAGTASWLALTHLHRPALAAAILAAGAAGMAWSYPPLLSGVVPAALVLAWLSLAHRARVGVVVAVALISVLIIAQISRWKDQFEHLATATGEYSTPLATSFAMIAIAMLLVGLAQQRRWHRFPVLALAAPCGFTMSAVAIALLAISSNSSPWQNYYVAKMMQAAWIACLPLIIGLIAWASDELALRSPRRSWRVWGGMVLASSLFISLVPDGRHAGLGGFQTYKQRMLERERALGEVNLVEISQLLGSSERGTALVLEPRGWSYRVSREAAGDVQWVRARSSASDWMNSLRGVKSTRQSTAALCLDSSDSTGCLRTWLEQDPDSSLTLIVPTGVAPREATELLARFPTRVLVVEEPQP